jgi:dipeptidyl aminopeptidase/acylaminoacyl peptidase
MRPYPVSLVLVLATAFAAPKSSPPPTSPSPPARVQETPSAAAKTPPATSAQGPAVPDTPSGAAAARDAELAKIATAVLETFSNSEPVLTRDGHKVLFVSNRDGLPQLYSADADEPEGPATRLVTSSERVTGAFPLADGKTILFQSDHGADENWSFFRVGLDGEHLVELTPGTRMQRDGILVVDGKPKTIFYSARQLSAPQSTIYSTSALAPGEEKPLYEHERAGFLNDVSEDGKWALFTDYLTGSENYGLLVDLTAGKAKAIFPTSGKAAIWSMAFAADDKRVFIATDGGADQALLLAIDLESGKEVARYVEKKPATARVSTLAVDKKGKLVALGIDAGNKSDVRLLDAGSLELATTVTVPLGTGSIGDFSEDGKRLPITWSTPSSPNDVLAIDTGSGKLTPLRKEPRPQLGALPVIDASITEIDGFGGTKIPVNVYLPAGVRDAKDKRWPVIVSYHGGPAGSSAVRWNPAASYFLSLGYVWVEPNVRGSGGFGRAFEEADNGPKRLAAFADIETTARWAASQPWADKDRMVVFGGSYGGYTVLIALSRWPDLWRAGVDLFGVVNLQSFMATTSGLIRQIFLLEFGDPEKDAAFLASISPLTDVAKIVDPLFVYAGANDPRVPRSESDLIVTALRERRVPVEYMVKDNEGHSLARRENQVEFYSRAARFLETCLK